jgi:hypothetical protein
MIVENERELTVEECDELAAALVEDAAALPPGPRKQSISKLAQCYRDLAKMKSFVLRNVN